jgi:tetratricopeptide (TPR) repeat protein
MAFVVLVAVAALLVPAHVSAQDSVVNDGYLQLYGGSPEDAATEFTRLRSQRAEALAPWFGSLFSTMLRLEYDETLEAELERGLDAFIDHAAARHRRNADDAEALFYLAQAHLLRGTFRFTYDKGMWGAARDGARSKGFAEEYVKRHPEHGDAYLVLGLYNYFVDIAPNFVKVLRVLLFLPAGNRAEGITQLERAAADGSMFAPFAQTALSEIYGTLEGRPRDAIAIAQSYLRRFPENLGVRLTLASIHMHPAVEEYGRAEQELKAVLARAIGDFPRHLAQRHSAVLGLASLRRTQWRVEEAVALLDSALQHAPAKPSWILPTLLLRRGNFKMLIDDPSSPADIRRVLANPEWKEWHEPAEQLLTALEKRARSGEGTIYTALIPGNRLVADDRFDEAKALYDTLAARHPGDWQVRYRLAYLDFAQERYGAAATGMQAIVNSSASMPDWLKAAALLHLAYTHDLAGRRPEALRLYRRVLDRYEDESSAGAARLGVISAYRRK